jgi:hypothetical protein
MNNPPDDRTRLLAEMLHGDWTSGPAAEMARRAAAHARLRRTVRRSAVAAGVVAAIAVTLFFSPRRPALAPASVVTTAAKPAYEIISDEELLATLRDRPLLVLPQENGTKKIVLLDR